MIAGILGATGLVGGHILSQLLAHSQYDKVYIFVRKPSNIGNARLQEIVCDFSQLDTIPMPEDIDVLFSALGTTRKKTPDLNEYRHIELGILDYFISQLKGKNLQQVHVVSSIGAGGSSKNFYLKIKTEMEQMVESKQTLMSCIYRPAMIRGERNEKRFTEKIFISVAKIFDFFLSGKAKKYRSIHAAEIAATMIDESLNVRPGHHVIYFHQKNP